MTDAELAQLIAQGHETNGVEFKSSGGLDDLPYTAKIVRAILGLTNRRDGGVLVVGVAEKASQLPAIEGVLAEHLATWDFNRLSGILAGYADPSAEIALETRTVDGRQCVVVEVREFAEIPVLCKKNSPDSAGGVARGPDGNPILRRGGCYVRSLRKPETIEVATQEDMRALLSLAVEKGVLRWVALSRAAGTLPGTSATPAEKRSIYKDETEGLL